jgi:alkanesulfonate monooxygenase SsuD/methylene tetrahydromethanopterin reductase-like flavin-dependent oxidoreductase (luciferase family)
MADIVTDGRIIMGVGRGYPMSRAEHGAHRARQHALRRRVK